MAALYPDAACPDCGRLHDLFCHDPDRHPHVTLYRFTCPVTGAIAFFRPAGPPQPVILAPGSAVPLTWAED